MSARSTPLAALLAERIREGGALTFAEYMRECLYHPEHGYYRRPAERDFADYYTSVDVHPVFGRLVARQFAQMWALCGRPAPFLLVEAGAGTGRLATHILDFAARELPELYAAAEYVAVEASAARRVEQEHTLTTHLTAGRAHSAAELPQEIPVGCIFSNELLDALPVHRVMHQDGELREIYVAAEGEKFVEHLGPLSTPDVADYFAAQGVRLADGQQAEAGLEAAAWIEEAGRRLGRGFMLTIDYGHEARELYNERHFRGTLLAYRAHRAGEDFYAAPGEQDLTAHVNFTALELAGRRAGLERTGRVTQTHFLLALGRANEFADLYDERDDESSRQRARQRLTTLIHPEGMGETFSVMVQHKAMAAPRLTGLEAW